MSKDKYSFILFGMALILTIQFLILTGCQDKNNGIDSPDSEDIFPGKGASVPFLSYQSQNAIYQGQLLEFSTEYNKVQSEASGRMAVKLQDNGNYVKFTLRQSANAMVLRYSMPDSENGGGIDGSLAVYANDVFIGTISLTSKFAWIYNLARGWPGNNDPSTGPPCRFFDDSRMLFDNTFPAGTEITLKKNDDVEYYIIDMAEFELVGAPLTQPENSLSITDFGAVPDGSDSRMALMDCIREAKAQGKQVWIPAGNFTIGDSFSITVNSVTVTGAGMWHSTFTGGAYFMVNGNNNHFSDFAMLGDVTVRVDAMKNCGFEARAGNNNRFENLWIEHFKCGFWVNGANGMVIKNCRIRNVFADGINITFQTQNSIIENCDLRNLGDDAIAVNSELNRDSYNNTVKNNTVRVPYHANGLAVYGGGNNTIQDNLVFDTVAYGAGINISSRFNPADYHGTTTVKGNVLVRTGSSASNSERGTNHGAIWLVAWEKNVSGLTFTDNRLINSVCDAITIDGNGTSELINIEFNKNSIETAQGYGINVYNGAAGSAAFKNTKITGALSGALNNPGSFTVKGIK